jgi:hypothetical protein
MTKMVTITTLKLKPKHIFRPAAMLMIYILEKYDLKIAYIHAFKNLLPQEIQSAT